MGYKYGDLRTASNGIIKWLQLNKYINERTTYGEVNKHLVAIRLQEEPNKIPSKDFETNARYVSKNYNFNIVTKYFKNK